MKASPSRDAEARDAEDTFDFIELWRTLQRRKRIIFGVTAVFVVLMAVYCIVSTRRYKATGEIEVQPETPDSLGLNSALGIVSSGQDSLLTNIDIQTQTNLLQSKMLALRVIEDLHLEGTKDFRPSFNPIGFVLGFFSPAGHPDPAHASLEDSPNRRDRDLAIFAGNLKVEPVAGTRLIDVTYLSADPQIAPAIVNHLMQALTDFSFQTGHSGSSASRWMDAQLSDLRAESERLQKEVLRIQRESGIVSSGATDTAGRDQAFSAIVDQMQQLSTTLSQAQANRILKGAIYEVMKTGDPELISGLSNLSPTAAAGLSASLTEIQSLRSQLVAAQAELDQTEAKFGSGYPRLGENRSRIAGLERAIKAEADRIAARAKNDFEIAARTEDSARLAYEKNKAEADVLSNKAISYAFAREEAESSRKLYDDLLSRSKEAGILEGLRSSKFTVVDKSMVPSKPARPRVLLYMAASLFLGISLGAGLALLIDLTDSRIVSVASLKQEFGRTVVGILPWISPHESAAIDQLESGSGSTLNLLVSKLPRSSYVEALRSLCTSLLLSRNTASPPQVIVITSAVQGEGKTTLSANFAVLLAQQEKRVLLVDANLRHPTINDVLNVSNSSGLTNLLTVPATGALSEIRPVREQPGLFVLTSGSVSSHPSELLGLARFGELIAEYRKNFDFIILDTAPILSVSDSLLVAGRADTVLLLARLRQTELQALQASMSRLEDYISPDFIKLVIDGVDSRSHEHRMYFEDSKSGSSR